MRTRTSRAIASLVLAATAACGKALPADAPPADAGATGDGSVDGAAPDATAQDGGPAVVAPPALPKCPLSQCPSTLPGPDCTDEDCAVPIEMDESGTVSTDGADRCVASGSAYVTDTRPRATSRRVAGVSFHLGTASPGGPKAMAIARIAIDGSATGERFEAVVENGLLRLCERSADVSTCTMGTPLANDVTIHLHGLVSSETPPRASFALTVACGAPQVLPVTRPFDQGLVRGAVGCVDNGGQECSITFDDVVIFTAPE